MMSPDGGYDDDVRVVDDVANRVIIAKSDNGLGLLEDFPIRVINDVTVRV